MKQQEIFAKIGSILAELNEQHHFLAQNPEKLNELELELFLANADFLADHVRIIQKLNQVSNEHISSTNATLKVEETNVLDILKPDEKPQIITAQNSENEGNDNLPDETKKSSEDFFKPDPAVNTFEFDLGQHGESEQFDYETKPVEEIYNRMLSDEEADILAEKKKLLAEENHLIVETESTQADDDEIGPEPFLIAKEVEDLKEVEPTVDFNLSKENEAAKPKEEEKPANVVVPQTAIIEDKPIFKPEPTPLTSNHSNAGQTSPKLSINDLWGKNNAPKEETNKAPISDLKQAISLNEKLLFIKDLFKGYNLAYAEAIEIINKMNSFEAADSYLQKQYAIKYDWASKQATVDQFYELLNRRFSI